MADGSALINQGNVSIQLYPRVQHLNSIWQFSFEALCYASIGSQTPFLILLQGVEMSSYI